MAIGFIPIWEVFALIQCKRHSCWLVIIVLECQCVRGCVKHGIGPFHFGSFICEVASGVIRHFSVHLVFIVRHGPHKISAACKHIIGILIFTCCGHELVGCIDGCECFTVPEHAVHARYVLCVET